MINKFLIKIETKNRKPSKLLTVKKSLRWHRRLGATIAVFIVFISLTGIVLNHSLFLNLHEIKLNNQWLFKWYNMELESEIIGYELNNKWILWMEDTLFLDGKTVDQFSAIKGAVTHQNIIIVASSTEIILLTVEGDIIEKMSSFNIPPGIIQNIGLSKENFLLIKTNDEYYQFDKEFLQWEKVDGIEANWSMLSKNEIPESIMNNIKNEYSGEGLSLYRIILDMHAGRFFTKFGIFFADFVALGLIFLTVTGIYNLLKIKSK